MRLLVLSKAQADKIRGTWKRYHVFIPVEVVAGTWYLLNLDRILELKPALKGEKYKDLRDAVMWFTVGDGSNLDIKYQEYLDTQSNE